MQKLTFKRLSDTATLPTRNNPTDAGLDLYANETWNVHCGSTAMFTTGVAVAIPEGHYGRVAPRSGLAVKHGIDVLAGVIDSSYRGEIKVLLINHGGESITIEAGDRIAQLIIEKIALPIPQWGEIDATERGEKGFGASGR
jgi:dUTP pyrophosphatase